MFDWAVGDLCGVEERFIGDWQRLLKLITPTIGQEKEKSVPSLTCAKYIVVTKRSRKKAFIQQTTIEHLLCEIKTVNKLNIVLVFPEILVLRGKQKNSLCALLSYSTMSAKSAISKEIFAPLDERMLGAVQVKRRTKKKIPFLATGGQGEYLTYICLSVTNKKPTQASITKVKQFEGSTSFVRRSQWMLEQLRQVNGIDPNRDSAEFDLLFENAFDQWVASTASEKCTFFQILHHTCQRYLTDRKPEFINCQSKIMGGNSILHSAADSVTSAVQKASQALNERGERLGRAEEKTEDMKNSAQQFAETAHKLAMKHKC
uniref:syntaxin-binding protein 6 n=1 Tax=Odobenus rosmarus divergens TaxID=9708 RepID=UPI00063CBF7F|nr:PREDICTED: syntaxin-binding protein 6 [Odobenus rosmarus divergens]